MIDELRASTAVDGSFCCRRLAPHAEMASPGVMARPLALTYGASTVTGVSVRTTVDACAVSSVGPRTRAPAETAETVNRWIPLRWRMWPPPRAEARCRCRPG